MLSRTILPAFARLLSLALPPRIWYRCALAMSQLLALLLRLSARTGLRPHRYETAILLNRILAFLTRTGRPFPVPWRMDAASHAALDSAAASGQGLVICSAHLPLIKVAVRALMETGRSPEVAIAAEPGPDGRIPIWGLTDRLATIKVGPDVLLRARTVLKRGESVLLLVDTLAGDYSPNIFRLAGATKANVLFFTAELAGDGCVGVRVFPPPFPACADPQQIAANLQALDREIKRISGPRGGNRFDTIPASRLT
jgi:hypothetical protein